MQDFQNNTEIFVKGGVIGRMDYFLNALKIFGLGMLAFIPVGLGSLLGSVGIILGGVITFVLFIPLFYFCYHNHFKRLRDIRGTTQNELVAIIIMCVLMIIPYVGIIPGLVLFFAEGKITGNGAGLEKLEEVFTPSPPQQSETDKISNIEKLHKLKEAGAITEEEFNKYKEDALKKMVS